MHLCDFRRNICNVSYSIVSSNPVQLFHILIPELGYYKVSRPVEERLTVHF